MSAVMVRAEGLDKAFTLHLRGGMVLPVLRGVSLEIHAGECVALGGPSGAGKTTLLRSLYGNYRVGGGRILVRHRGEMVDLARAEPRTILEIRAETLGYVSQFLRVVPRVPALDIVAEAAIARGTPPDAARAAARALLERLGIPRRLHALPPATFSGGEQQRVNLARGFIAPRPVLLLDEPTASLDAGNRDGAITLVQEAKAAGTAIVLIAHDIAVRDAIADRVLTLTPLQDAA
ncbi:MAG TPA: phosphonate C-P lyase system protein PhnL [Acetobacteraceae bacterium]|jgi:alpha-D-ribose 1-methylphosphonate 5-triphosphate synthase subunit PhnL|nr:phosphonate C-P lyase system protein PhnL [Acetobacteraceae bacterium]